MNQTDADALLVSIVKYASLSSESNFTLHASDGVHMSKVLAAARAVTDITNLCGYFQHDKTEKIVNKLDEDGWEREKRSWTTTYRPTGVLEDVSNVEYVRLLKAFFRSGSVVATPNATSTLANMDGPIPAGFTGHTNAIGTATYAPVANMRAIISNGSNWQLVTVYPIA